MNFILKCYLFFGDNLLSFINPTNYFIDFFNYRVCTFNIWFGGTLIYYLKDKLYNFDFFISSYYYFYCSIIVSILFSFLTSTFIYWWSENLSYFDNIYFFIFFHCFCLFWICIHNNFFAWYLDLFRVIYRSYLLNKNGNS